MLNHWSQPYFHQPICQISPLRGGLQHHPDLVILKDQSRWVCKRFNSLTWLGKVTLSQLKVAENLSSIAAIELNLSTSSLTSSEDSIVRLEKLTYGTILPYCEGSISNAINEEQAYLLGKKLAQLHCLSSFYRKRLKKNSNPFPPISFPDELNINNDYSNLNGLIQKCNTSLYQRESSRHWLVSHRDLNLSNIIWKDEKHPYFIDWESTGLIHPTIELIGLAMNCAGISALDFNIDLYKATIQGYKSHSAYPPLPSPLWVQILHSWLLWYTFCLSQKETEYAIACLAAIELIQSKQELILQAL